MLPPRAPLIIGIALSLLAPAATAQSTRGEPVDSSAARDSIAASRGTVTGPHHAGMYLVFAALPVATGVIGAVTLVAPTAFLLINMGKPPIPPREIDPALNFRSYQVGATALGDTAQNGGYGASFERMRAGRYAEARVATWRLPSQFQYQTVRVGRFWHRTPRLAGGVIVGYQHAPQQHTQSGPELALPLLIIDGGTELRFEPSYVFTSERIQLNYRLRWDARLGRSPVRAGVDFELKGIREPTPFTGGLSVILSVRP